MLNRKTYGWRTATPGDDNTPPCDWGLNREDIASTTAPFFRRIWAGDNRRREIKRLYRDTLYRMT